MPYLGSVPCPLNRYVKHTARIGGLILCLWCLWTGFVAADQPVSLVFRGDAATVEFALDGGGLIDFRLSQHPVNPLNWEVSTERGAGAVAVPRPQGHFLCLDRWGAPSEAEAARGIPFHGEASQVMWQVVRPVMLQGGRLEGEMACSLPLASMAVSRTIVMEVASTAMIVTERITSTGRLGRLYNLVQHPTIAPPFLDDTTIVDSNANLGFSQDGPVPDSQNAASLWPQVVLKTGTADLRRFHSASKDGHDVSSFVFADDVRFGWVTACQSESRLLLGYFWQTADYPWLNIWRHWNETRAAARGLEFGTTGYHQPFGVLLRQHRILDRQLYGYLDAGETHERSYLAFLAPLPENFAGVGTVEHRDGYLRITESGSVPQRVVLVPLKQLPWPNAIPTAR